MVSANPTDKEFLQSLWLWTEHDTATRWLLNDVSCALREFREGKIGGNITIHIDDNGVPGRVAELRMRKGDRFRERVLNQAKEMS